MQRIRTLAVLIVVAFSITGVAQAQAQGMGRGRMMGMHGDSSHMADMTAIHAMLTNHTSIKRTVTDLSNGVRTLTESSDKEIAAFIKQHMASMTPRVRNDDQFCPPMTSEALATIFRLQNDIRIEVTETATGVDVIQTSDNAQAVAALQQHAKEVTALVEGGHAAMRDAMMQNGGMGGRGHGMMRRGM